jgi:hypothetical protein
MFSFPFLKKGKENYAKLLRGGMIGKNRKIMAN